MLLDDNNTKDLRAMMEANIIGLCICTREAVKLMKQREVDGHIININRYFLHINSWLLNSSPYVSFFT